MVLFYGKKPVCWGQEVNLDTVFPLLHFKPVSCSFHTQVEKTVTTKTMRGFIKQIASFLNNLLPPQIFITSTSNSLRLNFLHFRILTLKFWGYFYFVPRLSLKMLYIHLWWIFYWVILYLSWFFLPCLCSPPPSSQHSNSVTVYIFQIGDKR